MHHPTSNFLVSSLLYTTFRTCTCHIYTIAIFLRETSPSMATREDSKVKKLHMQQTETSIAVPDSQNSTRTKRRLDLSETLYTKFNDITTSKRRSFDDLCGGNFTANAPYHGIPQSIEVIRDTKYTPFGILFIDFMVGRRLW